MMILIVEFHLEYNNNRADQCNPNHKATGPGHRAGYNGPTDKRVLDNKSIVGNPNHPHYWTGRN